MGVAKILTGTYRKKGTYWVWTIKTLVRLRYIGEGKA